MTRIPKPGDRLLPKYPTGSIVARICTTDSADLIFTASEVRITTYSGNPDGMAVAMWAGSEKNVCYVEIPALDEDSYVFADEFDEIITSDIKEIRSGDFVVANRLSSNSNYSVSGIVVEVETRNLGHRIYMKDSGFVFEVPTTRKATYSIRRKKPSILKPNSVVTPMYWSILGDKDGHNYWATIGIVSSDGSHILADWFGPVSTTTCIPIEDIDMSSIKESNE